MPRFDEVLLTGTCNWISKSEYIVSAVLFGSTARRDRILGEVGSEFSDIDLHIIVNRGTKIDRVNWQCELPVGEYCMAAYRSASGGVRKVTVIFTSGQIDLVVVPIDMMRLASLACFLGFHLKHGFVRAALNEMATCLHGGYRFLKGERRWGSLYRNVSRLPGVRLNDAEVVSLANSAVCDVLWVRQKLRSGELVAAQHVLHTRVIDVNLRLWRELRFRRLRPPLAFGLGRKIEETLDKSDLERLRVSYLLRKEEIERATQLALNGLLWLMQEIVPEWAIRPQMSKLLDQVRPIFPHS